MAGSFSITTITTCFSWTAKRGGLVGWAGVSSAPIRALCLPMALGNVSRLLDILFRTGWTHRRKVSIGRGGHHANGYSSAPAVSQHGRFVAFESAATNLVWGDHNDNSDVFVRDRALHKTFLVSVGTSGTQGNRGSFEPVISAHGRFVAFSSTASNLVHGDNNSRVDVFMYDRLSHATRLISVGRDGKAGHGASYGPAISANARLVTFLSGAANLVRGDSNPAVDAFVAARSGGG